MLATEKQSPPTFEQLVENFCTDLLTTFPEQQNRITKSLNIMRSNNEQIRTAFQNKCHKTFTTNSNSIKNADAIIFETVDFLPGVCFKSLWAANITDSTRSAIWAHLTLILEKCESKRLENILDETPLPTDTDTDTTDTNNVDTNAIIEEHMKSLMEGKIGKLASEIAEKSMSGLGLDMNDNMSNPQELMAKLFSNPQDLMNVISQAKDTMTDKISSGEISVPELMTEMQEFMKGMDLGNSDKGDENKGADDMLKHVIKSVGGDPNMLSAVMEKMVNVGGAGAGAGGVPDIASIMQNMMTASNADGVNPLEQMMKSLMQPANNKPKNTKYTNLKKKAKAKHQAREEAKLKAIIANLQKNA